MSVVERPTAGRALSDAALHAAAARVRVVAFDVDGVCTDGRLYYGEHGEVLHAFHARDGLALVRARVAGLVLVAVSGRTSKNVHARLHELKVPHICQGVQHKERELQRVLEQVGASWDACAWIGDDVNDVPCLLRAGVAACPADAADDVFAHAHVVTRRRGGEGALRELLELVLRARGQWTVDAPDPSLRATSSDPRMEER